VGISFVNWQAIAAVATFFAVLVALYPIVRGEFRRRAQARNLRVRLLVQLTRIRPMLARRFQGTPLGPYTTGGLTGDEGDVVNLLDTLLSQSHILESKEHDLVSIAVANLVLARSVKSITPDTARHILNLIDQTRDELEKSKFLHGKLPKKPWD